MTLPSTPHARPTQAPSFPAAITPAPRTRRAARAVSAALLAALALSGGNAAGAPAATAPPAGTDAAASTTALEEARRIIRSQIDAFAADDAVRAFSFAAPGIQARFGSPDAFLAMVRDAYPAVHRAANLQFLDAEATADEIVQPVEIEDRQGRLWIAVYGLTRQSDASWRIDGCRLVPQAGTRT